MTDTRKDHPHLRVVGADGIDPNDPFANPEKIRYRPPPEVEAAQPKLQRRPGRLFAQVELAWLIDPRFQRLSNSTLRLYLLLQIRTIRGSRAVRLTNQIASEAGVDRHHKSRRLRQLEKIGFVRVVRSGNQNPEVTWLPPPRL
jgi:hypothetical protein